MPALAARSLVAALVPPLKDNSRMYDGNVWQPVGFGRLSADNISAGAAPLMPLPA